VAMKDSTVWAVEVKAQRVMRIDDWLSQARAQAVGRRRWCLMAKLPQSHSWLIYRQGEEPTIWEERR